MNLTNQTKYRATIAGMSSVSNMAQSTPQLPPHYTTLRDQTPPKALLDQFSDNMVQGVRVLTTRRQYERKQAGPIPP